MTPNRAEHINLTGRLEDCYQHHLPDKTKRDTYVDPEGYALWTGVYLEQRKTLAHEEAWNETERQIHLAGIPQVPLPVLTSGTHRNPLIGELRRERDAFLDNTGLVLPTYAHAGDWFALYVRDRMRVQAEMHDTSSAEFHGVRSWMTLGCGNDQLCPMFDDRGRPTFWRGFEVGPKLTAGYTRYAENFMADLQSEGLRLVWSQGDPGQLGATMAQRCDYARWLAQLTIDIPNVIDFVDAGNEAWQNDSYRLYSDGNPEGVANMQRFIQAFKDAGGRGLCSTTSPPSENGDDLVRYSPKPCDVYDDHSFRGDRWYDKRRHPFATAYEGKPILWHGGRNGMQSEPPGHGTSVSAIANIEELDNEALGDIAVMSVISRCAFVWFSGAGVKMDPQLDDERGFWTVAKAINTLPRDIMRFRTLHHSGESWRHNRVFILPDSVVDPSVRCDGAIHDDGRFAYIMDGPSGTHRFTIARSFTGTITNLGTLETHPFSHQAGERVDVSWIRGRLVQGRVI
jgi:hypothetical protein